MAAHLGEGVLELHAKGHGYLRSTKKNFVAQPADPFVASALIKDWHLRQGQLVAGPLEPNRQGAHGAMRLAKVVSVEGKAPDKLSKRRFDELTPIDPREMIRLETGKEPLT